MEQYDNLDFLYHDRRRKSPPRFWVGFLSGLISGVALSLLVSFVTLRLAGRSGRPEPAVSRGASEAAGEGSGGRIDLEALTGENADKKIGIIADLIETNYYHSEDINTDAMEQAMYSGIVSALGDKYSTYYSPTQLDQILEGTQGIYSGIGAYVSMDSVTGYPVVAGTMKGTPAEAAGLLMDDIIYEVDGTNTEGMELEEVVSRIKGQEGTKVSLTVIRSSGEVKVEVERRRISAPTVSSEYYEEDGIGYIGITEFDDVTTSQFEDAMSELKGKGMKGLILDLRGNPGGNLDTVCDISEMLLPEGTIVSTRDKYGEVRDYKSSGKSRFSLPLAVLVNGYSASASEILSGAVQDYGIGTIVGTRTYGKGVVQQIITLNDGSAVKLTVSNYFTPSGKNINGVGIEPDIEVELDTERYNSEEHYDNQLEEARRVVREMM